MTQEADPIAFTFLNEVAIVEQLARTRFERVLPDGLKVAHFAMLNHLVRLGDGRTPLQLSQAFEVTKAAITNTLGRLEARKLIRVAPDDTDGRSKRVFLTDRGRAARQKCVAALGPAMTGLLAVVPERALAEAMPALKAVRKWLDENRIKNR